jgi:hypothetical protein
MSLGLDAYAAHKKLPRTFLETLGVHDEPDRRGLVRVVIPYYDSNHAEVAIRYRTSFDHSDPYAFMWRRGDKALLYGLDRLPDARAQGYVIIVEGESDCQTLWWHGFPAIGVPGAPSGWKEDRDASALDGVNTIFLAKEPGAAALKLLARLKRSTISNRLRIVDMNGAKDPSALHCEDPSAFRERFEVLLKDAKEPEFDVLPEAWARHAMVDERGNPLMNLANALTALRMTPELANVLAYDELLRAAVLTAELPPARNATALNGRTFPRPITDEDVSRLQEFLQWTGLRKIGREVVHQAVDCRSQEHSFHRLRDYLEGLKWDGKPRLEPWLINYLGAKDSLYHRAIGRMFPIAMVARIFKPGCKADYVLILQGPQGDLKSEVFRILGGEWFSDSLQDIHSKDASQHLRGKWLIELPELSALNKGDIEAWKAFITRTTERYRSPYGRKETIEPRQCVFGGTTNKEEYLQDETGNRRYWPARIGEIDLAALAADRDQLFAEAVRLYLNNEPWWPERKFEREIIAPEQDARFESDVWEPIVANYLDNVIPEKDRIRVCDVAMQCLAFETSHIGTADQRRIRRILHHLGWRQHEGPKRTADRFYFRPEKVGKNEEPFRV